MNKLTSYFFYLIACVFVCQLSVSAQCPSLIDPQYAIQSHTMPLDVTYDIQPPTATVVYETQKKINLTNGAKLTSAAVSVKMDIYRPVDLPSETNIQRPVVILCHGANRRRYSPEWQIRAQDLTKRGYVVVSIDYRADSYSTVELAGVLLCNTTTCNRREVERQIYSNAMDVHNAMGYLIANQSTYKINPNQFIIGGHSLGGATSFAASCIDKNEIPSGTFPSTFTTDAFYVNLATYRSRIKGAMLWAPATLNVNYIDSTDNVPLFVFHGTYDPAAPFYSGKQFCDPANPVYYGGAAIAERVDGFTNPYSYYFVEATGAGHITSVSCQYLPFGDITDGLTMLWAPDMLRFMKTTMLGGIVNQRHKVITPLNNSNYDYCTGVQNTYCNGNADEFIPVPSPTVSCFTFPTFTLTQLPWNEGINSYNTCTWPIVSPVPDGTCGVSGKYEMFNQFSTLSSSTLTLSPNPTRNNLNLTYTTTTTEDATITLYDLTGKAVLQTTETATEGTNNYNLQLTDLPTGMYIVQLQTATQRLTQKVQVIR